MDLMGTKPVKLQEEIRVEANTPLRKHVQLRHPASNAIRIKLLIPSCIERVSQIDTTAVAAEFHHLRPTVQQRAGSAKMGISPHYASNSNGSHQLKTEKVGYFILAQLADPPARDV